MDSAPSLRSHFSLIPFLLLAPALPAAEGTLSLRLIAPDGWLPGVPVVARVEVREASGGFARGLWDAEAVLSADVPGITLGTERVVLRNGLGSALVAISGSGDFRLTASLGDLEASRVLRDRRGEAIVPVSGTLAEPLVEWSGIIDVASTVTVPAGSTLRILAGTMVLVAGVPSASPRPTNGASIVVRGAIESLGDDDRPVVITARDPARPWGQIHHDRAAPSLYRSTIITRAGHAPGEGHTGRGPTIRPRGSRIVFRGCTIGYDHPQGKVMHASGSDLELHECLLVRSVMGPEIGSTALLFRDSWAVEMFGTDDNDGIYLHGQSAGQAIVLTGSVFAAGDDDGIDTLGSDVTVEGCIVRDFAGTVDADAKGMSLFGGEVDIRGCLIIDNHVGISAKDETAAIVRIERSTVVAGKVGIQAEMKDSSMAGARIRYDVRSSIVRAPDAVRSDYPEHPEDIALAWTDSSEAWPGEGNILSDPLFVDPSAGDYRLAPGSPCIDAGDPAATLDPDGSRADMGAIPASGGPIAPRFLRGRLNGDGEFDLSDPLALLLHLFGGASLGCADAGDVDDDGALALADAVLLLEHLFRGGPPPAAPAEACGVDATEDALGCLEAGCDA